MSSGSRPSLFKRSTARLTSVVSHLSSDARPKVVVCRNLGPAMPKFLERTDIEIVLWPEDRSCTRTWLLENIPGAAGVLVLLSEAVNPEFVDTAGPNLRVISTMSVGYEHISLPLMAERKIRVGYTPDVLTEAVADLSVMLALMAGRNDGVSYDLVKTGEASRFWPKYIGFLGFGRIAQATLARLVPFGITRCVYTGSANSDPNAGGENSTAPEASKARLAAVEAASQRDASLRTKHKLATLERVDLDRLARESDVLFVLTPGGADTYHLVDAAFLRKMKPMSVLVNTSRGTVVDSEALATALKEKWIWGAGLDVVEGEPRIDGEHPLVKEPKCIIVPHIGSATFQTREDMAARAIDNLLGGLGFNGGAMPAELGI